MLTCGPAHERERLRACVSACTVIILEVVLEFLGMADEPARIEQHVNTALLPANTPAETRTAEPTPEFERYRAAEAQMSRGRVRWRRAALDGAVAFAAQLRIRHNFPQRCSGG